MRSDVVTKGLEAAPHRALLYGCGMRREDLGKLASPGPCGGAQPRG